MKLRQQRKKSRRIELKTEVMAHYSGYNPPRCGKCGKTEIAELTIDHAFNDGSQLRKIYPMQKRNICKWLKLHEYPVGYQVLCKVCNQEKQRDSKIYFAGDIKPYSRQDLEKYIAKYNKNWFFEGDSLVMDGKKVPVDELFSMSFKISEPMKPLFAKMQVNHVSLIDKEYQERKVTKKEKS